jgi:hypothetical protein
MHAHANKLGLAVSSGGGGGNDNLLCVVSTKRIYLQANCTSLARNFTCV